MADRCANIPLVIESRHLHAARHAVKRSARTRAALRGQNPQDRDERLNACLAELEAAMAPIEDHRRRGPQYGRSVRDPEVAAASEAIQAERRKVRGMLRRASGGRKRRPSPKMAFSSFRGRVQWEARALAGLEADWGDLKARTPPRSEERREQVAALLGRLAEVREHMRVTKLRKHRSYLTGDRVAALEAQLRQTTADADRLRNVLRAAERAPLKFTIPKAERPKGAPRRSWTYDEAYEALRAWEADHGRPARKADLAGDPSVPSWAKVRELFGGMPGSLAERVVWTPQRIYGALTTWYHAHGRKPTAADLEADDTLPTLADVGGMTFLLGD